MSLITDFLHEFMSHLHINNLCSPDTLKSLVGILTFYMFTVPTFNLALDVVTYSMIWVMLFNYLCREYHCFHIFLCPSFILFLHSSLTIHSMLFIPFSLIPVFTSCIHEFRVFLFLFLPGGHHANVFWGTLSTLIPCRWPYEFNR